MVIEPSGNVETMEKSLLKHEKTEKPWENGHWTIRKYRNHGKMVIEPAENVETMGKW